VKPKQNLFELIKSLNKSEKRYFKLYASLQQGSKNYLKLFNEIDRQEEYDEPQIKEKFKNEKFIKQLTFTKNYLYKLILKSLIAYQGEKSIDARLNELISSSKILLNKGLAKQYFEALNSAYKLALTHERFSYCLQILELKNLFLKLTGQPSETEESINNEIRSIIGKINNFYEYNNIVNRLILLYRQAGKIRNEDNTLLQVLEVEKTDILQDPSRALSQRAKENFYFIHQLIADFRGDMDLLYKNCVERLSIMTAHPGPFTGLSINYFHDALTYALAYAARTKNGNKFSYYMKILDGLPVNSKTDEISLFFIKAYVNTVRLMAEHRFEEAIQLLPDIRKNLKLYKQNLEGDKELLIIFHLMVILMMTGRYSDALNELNYMLHSPYIKYRPELEWYTRLLSLIIHYELKNYKYLDYLIVSTYRYLYKKKKIYRLERTLLNFIKKLTNVQSDEQLRTRLLTLRKELMEFKSDRYEKNAFKYFDFIYWIDNKLEQQAANSK
jgi:hypothetical protein